MINSDRVRGPETHARCEPTTIPRRPRSRLYPHLALSSGGLLCPHGSMRTHAVVCLLIWATGAPKRMAEVQRRPSFSCIRWCSQPLEHATRDNDMPCLPHVPCKPAVYCAVVAIPYPFPTRSLQHSEESTALCTVGGRSDVAATGMLPMSRGSPSCV